MEVIFEALFEIFGELILQVLFEALAEVGIHLTRKDASNQPPRSRTLLVMGYALLGVIAGGVSLLVFAQSLAHTHNGHLATLLLVPLGAALMTVWIGKWRARRGQAPVSLDRFMYAYVFALGMACVRYVWAG